MSIRHYLDNIANPLKMHHKIFFDLLRFEIFCEGDGSMVM